MVNVIDPKDYIETAEETVLDAMKYDGEDKEFFMDDAIDDLKRALNSMREIEKETGEKYEFKIKKKVWEEIKEYKKSEVASNDYKPAKRGRGIKAAAFGALALLLVACSSLQKKADVIETPAEKAPTEQSEDLESEMDKLMEVEVKEEKQKAEEIKAEIEKVEEKFEKYKVIWGDTLHKIIRKKCPGYKAQQIIYFGDNFFGPMNGKKSTKEYPSPRGKRHNFEKQSSEKLQENPNYIVAGKLMKFPVGVEVSYDQLPRRFQEDLGGDRDSKYVVGKRVDNNETIIANLDTGIGASVEEYIAELEGRV